MLRAVTFVLFLSVCCPAWVRAQVGAVEISSSSGGLMPGLRNAEYFGRAVTSLGDLDGDGVVDVVVGATAVERSGIEAGAVYVLFLNADGTVRQRRKIGAEEGGTGLGLEGGDAFGYSLARVGDLDGDGIAELAVGAVRDDERGAVHILFLNGDGTVRRHARIGSNEGGLTDALDERDDFGHALAHLGDLDGDGLTELAAGAPGDGIFGDKGAVYVLTLSSEGTVARHRRLDEAAIGVALDADGRFGSALAAFGEREGGSELAVGAPGNDGRRGAVFLLSLEPKGSVAAARKIAAPADDALEAGDLFGSALASLGDLDADGRPDLAVGAVGDDGRGSNQGAVWLLALRDDATVRSRIKISHTQGGFGRQLSDDDAFGASIAVVGDLDADGTRELAIGAPGDDGNGSNRGAVWILSVDSSGVLREAKINDGEGNLFDSLSDDDLFGSALAALGDLDGDGISELAAGAPRDDDGGENRGAVYILFLNVDGTVRQKQKISARAGGFDGSLADNDFFGAGLAALDDLDGDGVPELAVGATGGGGLNRGAVWILFLDDQGRVKAHSEIGAGTGGFAGSLGSGDLFGRALAALGDLDGDGLFELAVGSALGPSSRGAVWMLSLTANARVDEQAVIDLSALGDVSGNASDFGRSLARIDDLDGDGIPELAAGFLDERSQTDSRGAVAVLFLQQDGAPKPVERVPQLRIDGDLDDFGSALTSAGDLDGDDRPEVLVGAAGDGSDNRGAAWLLFLHGDGTFKRDGPVKIGAGDDALADRLGSQDRFGSALAVVGDLDGDAVADVAVGAPRGDDGGQNRGAVWVLTRVFNPPPRFIETRIEPGPDAPSADASIVFSTRVADNSDPASVVVTLRRAGEPEFTSIVMNEGEPGSFSIRMPGAAGVTGVEYYVTVVDDLGAATRWPESGIAFIPTVVSDLRRSESQPSGEREDEYRLFSLPLDVSSPIDGRGPRAVLEDDFGPYDPTRWRLFEPVVDGGRIIGGRELPEIDFMEPGEVFMLLVKDPDRVISTGPGRPVSTAGPFSDTLEAGWNLIGNPFSFLIPLDHVTTASGSSLSLFSYAGAGAWEIEPNGLRPFEGYAAYSAGEDVLFIDPDLSPAEPAPAPSPAWTLRIRAESGRLHTAHTVAGVTDGASDAWDDRDAPAPPPLGDFVSVYFPHPEWAHGAVRYSADFRPLSDAGAEWQFEVAGRTADPVRLTFEDLKTVPRNYDVWLLDEVVGIRQDLRRSNTYTLAGVDERTPRPLRLVVGLPGAADAAAGDDPPVPVRFALSAPFPNPFRGSATIRYSLPEEAPVTLDVYDLRGARVANLAAVTAQPAGHHAAIWDGRDAAGIPVSSGVYLVRLRAGAFTTTRTMVRVR